MPEYVCVKYLSAAGEPRVGSGYLVRDGIVLTANHVAAGKRHEVWCDGVRYNVAGKVLSEKPGDVDLAVLRLADGPTGPPALPLGQVSRNPGIIHDCIAVGYPLWSVSTQHREYSSQQVEGAIRTANRVPKAGNSGSQLLRLTITWLPGDPPVTLPAGLPNQKPDDLWSGMSGAVVTSGDNSLVIGVVHSHDQEKDRDSLILTPLLALQELSADKQREFCDALGISGIDALIVANPRGPADRPGAAVVAAPAELSMRPVDVSQAMGVQVGDGNTQIINNYASQAAAEPGTAEDAFSDALRDDLREELERLGVPVPQRWDYVSLWRLSRDCDQRASEQRQVRNLLEARDRAKALWLTIAALPMLDKFGGHVIGIKKLQYLYWRNVGADPESATLDGLLYQAAGAGIREAGIAQSGGQPGDPAVTALGRFMLGIACHWRARQAPAERIDIKDMLAWVENHLQPVQSVDIRTFMQDIDTRRPTWVLIDLEGKEDKGDWPTAYVYQVVSVTEDATTTSSAKTMKTPPLRKECQVRSIEDLEKLLRDILSNLPDGEVFIDLFLPRPLMGVRLAYRDLCQVSAGLFESLSLDHKPHLRWRLHYQRGKPADRLRRRFKDVRWMDAAEDISLAITGDRQLLKSWISHRSRMPDPPYFVGISSEPEQHDPLGALLLSGYGFLAWFPDGVSDEVLSDARNAADDADASQDRDRHKKNWNRKDRLPLALAECLQEHEPMIIWSDPTGRADFDMPRHSPWHYQESATT